MAIGKFELFDDYSVVIDLVSESVGDGTNQEFIRWLRCLMQLSHIPWNCLCEGACLEYSMLEVSYSLCLLQLPLFHSSS